MTRNKKKSPSSPLPLDSVRHKDKRANIPTEELRDFVREEDAGTKYVAFPGLLYARDETLDPQLVWRGKDAPVNPSKQRGRTPRSPARSPLRSAPQGRRRERIFSIRSS